MKQFRFALVSIAAVACVFSAADSGETSQDRVIEEIVVSARASFEFDRVSKPSTATIESSEIQTTGAVHPNEVMNQVPGVWISRGSGQEHLTAIRSGVLTGAGACGAYMVLENGIPIRPASFCNVNGLLEVNTEQATTIEVIRGPASSRYGGNALHGAINVITLATDEVSSVSIEGGEYGWYRLQGSLSNDPFNIGAVSSSTDGWRDDTGYAHHKLNAQLEQSFGRWSAVHTLAFAQLNQETGGYVLGEDAYADETLRTTNPNPEAYRDASALRWTSHLSSEDFIWSAYARQSDMDFLMHFLPGQPKEHNGHDSIGSLFRWFRYRNQRALEFGLQAELFDVDLSETQHGPTNGSAFLVATRPEGTHYDFSVSGMHLGVFHDAYFDLSEKLAWSYRIRSEMTRYDYTNHHLVGNTKDDGTDCGFGGCLYTRPADREDQFRDHSFKLSVERKLNDELTAHVMAGSSFRPPQITEMYRLQNGQEVADIDSEGLSSIEIGINQLAGENEFQLSLYLARNVDVVIRDPDGFNKNGGKVRSSGIEWLVERSLSPKHSVRLTGTIASHQYDADLDIARGGMIKKGNDVDTAPTGLLSARWLYKLSERLRFAFDVVRVGEYYLDLDNSATYPGHTVSNVSIEWEVRDQLTVYAHIRNLADEWYADRADLAFGNLRYFPAMPRNVRIGLKMEL